jgi:hypothetical protein
MVWVSLILLRSISYVFRLHLRSRCRGEYLYLRQRCNNKTGTFITKSFTICRPYSIDDVIGGHVVYTWGKKKSLTKFWLEKLKVRDHLDADKRMILKTYLA